MSADGRRMVARAQGRRHAITLGNFGSVASLLQRYPASESARLGDKENLSV